MTGVFGYLNQIEKVRQLKCPYTEVEQFTDVHNMVEVLKNISLYVYKTTNEKLESSDASTKDKTNKLFALDLLKMSTIHMKYLTISMTASKIDQFKCPKM